MPIKPVILPPGEASDAIRERVEAQAKPALAKPQEVTGLGRFMLDPSTRIQIGVVNALGKRQIAWSVSQSGALADNRIYPLTRKDALTLADALMRAAFMVDE